MDWPACQRRLVGVFRLLDASGVYCQSLNE
jgi:hypothetical protein